MLLVFHAMVTDKVVIHFQLVEDVFFVKRFTSEIKTDCIKEFLVFRPGKLGFLCCFVVFFEAWHRFYNEAETSQRRELNGVQSDISIKLSQLCLP